MDIPQIIAQRLGLRQAQVDATIALLDGGATIPFISRYRKEATGGMNEVQVAALKDMYGDLGELSRRREYILSTIEAQGALTDELRQRIETCWDAVELEDIYLPFKPKRKTRASEARRRGLEPLAQSMLLKPNADPFETAKRFITDEVPDVEAALQGARDIIAEQVSEDERTRQTVRRSFELQAVITSRVVKSKADEAAKYRDYFEWSEPLARCTSHRLLAMRRGEAEGFLRVSIAPRDEEKALSFVERLHVRRGSAAAPQVEEAVADAFKRLLCPSIENEFAAASKRRADEEAIQVFTKNLKQLLLAAPLGQKRIMGIDPGIRTGCKVVCLSAEGDLLHNETIYPHGSRGQWGKSVCRIADMAERYQIEAVAVGSGTAGRETEELVREARLEGVDIFLVSEDGASVYSASALAREEFPDYDVTVRGAVSIGRRLADPLAELVKIDPKAIGVGQYQHDVDQSALRKSLDQTVEFCVNTVGVNLNTAGKQLLTYVSGLGPALAQNIVDFRSENGAFKSRAQLLKVPRLGAKAYQQSAGFLRIVGGDNPLDNTAVHPEHYALVERMAKDAGCDVPALIASKERRAAIDLNRYCTDEIGLPTLTDIMAELDRPGRDPRGVAETFSFAENVHSIEDLAEGMELPGVVTNLTKFGAFVDLGIKTKGLVHVSQIANRRIADPADVLRVQQHVMVRVVEIDEARGRIALTMKGVAQTGE